MLQNTWAFRASSGIIPGSSCNPPSDAEWGGSTLQAPSSQKFPRRGGVSQKIPGWGVASHPAASGSGRGHVFLTKFLGNISFIFPQDTVKRENSLQHHEKGWEFSKPPEEFTLHLEESPVSFNRCSSWKYLNKKKRSQFRSHSLEKGLNRNNNVSWDFY